MSRSFTTALRGKRGPANVRRSSHSTQVIPFGIVSSQSTEHTDAYKDISVRDEVIVLSDTTLESGARIDNIDVHLHLEGTINANADNVILVVHALTGTTAASSWWKNVVGVGCAIDPQKHAVLSANLLGGCDGTAGPSNSDPDALPPISTRDQALVLARLLDHVGVKAPLLICGGSLGGMVTLEFAASFPDRVRGAVVFAAPAAQTAQGLAWNTIMRRAIELGGVREGLALARMVGMLSYRTPESLESRFGQNRSISGGFQVNEWLDAHGERLVERFDATSYGALINAMDLHDVGRGRNGIAAALAPVANRLTGVGIHGDLLYPDSAVRDWAATAGATYVDINSQHGHDAFLLEAEQVSSILSEAIDKAAQHGVTSVDNTVSEEAATPNAQTIRVALAGCGHVGGSLLELLAERQSRDGSNRVDPVVSVKRILVRHADLERPSLTKAVSAGITPQDACITDADRLLGGDIDVLVEAIGGTTTARFLVESALKRGIRVVTANKALLGERGGELKALAQKHGTRIDFEGAVCGAIPIVRCVRSGAAGVGVKRISGILNGTSNFVLGEITKGASFSKAVSTAQELGYAEADPTRDLNGQDAEDKLRILAWLAFGIEPGQLKVVRSGITEEVALWASTAAREGDRVKLLAVCEEAGGELVATIQPTRVSGGSAWAGVEGPFNRVVVESESAGALTFHGPGAGGMATAGAVLADLLQH